MLDLLDAGPCAHSWPLPQALSALQQAGKGVAVLLNCAQDSSELLLDRLLPGEGDRAPHAFDLRTYGVGAQILRDVGVVRMRLMGQPRRLPSMAGYGLEITGYIPKE